MIDESHPFREFLTKSNILSASLALIVSMQFTALLESIFYDIIDPVIVYLVYGNNDYSFKTYVVTIFGVEMTIGNFILLLNKMLFSLAMVYIFVMYLDVRVKEK